MPKPTPNCRKPKQLHEMTDDEANQMLSLAHQQLHRHLPSDAHYAIVVYSCEAMSEDEGGKIRWIHSKGLNIPNALARAAINIANEPDMIPIQADKEGNK